MYCELDGQSSSGTVICVIRAPLEPLCDQTANKALFSPDSAHAHRTPNGAS